ncbi:MAG TPA: SUMF1/EgtB/PvdO family nonheme iron enzyme, partial [Kofleriaceae bacterium]|nr:SUMF1/EgtB/PvdO family nonheme iron enzyme [Kofleriaceae bacterium]
FARWNGQACAAAGPAEGPPAVGTSKRDVTPEGVHDLGGSVSEWTADAFVDRLSPCDGGCVDPVTEPTSPDQARVIRGGNWAGGIEWLRGAGRGSAPAADARPNIGVRCVRALAEGGAK